MTKDISSGHISADGIDKVIIGYNWCITDNIEAYDPKNTSQTVVISRMCATGSSWGAVSWAGDQPLCSLTDLKLILIQGLRKKNPLSGDGEGGPGVRTAPSSCSHHAWLITPPARAVRGKKIIKWKKKQKNRGALTPHTRVRIGCVVMATMSYSCQVLISFHSNTIWRREQTIIPDIIQLKGVEWEPY